MAVLVTAIHASEKREISPNEVGINAIHASS
jgi:hypothetical protein